MQFAGHFRTVRRSDQAVPKEHPRSISGKGDRLDIRIWRGGDEPIPLLLVNASRKQGIAVQRNRFRRRVRMAFLEILRENIHLGLPCVVWVRPMRGVPQGCRISYPEMFEQLQKALKRWNAR